MYWFSKKNAEIGVAFSDMHANSKMGLGWPGLYDAEGIEIGLSTGQQWLLGRWITFWKEIEALKRQFNAIVYGFSVGDAIDNNRHSNAQLVSTNTSVMKRICRSVFIPAREVCDILFMVKGTPGHVGDVAEEEEEVAEWLEAESIGHGERTNWFARAEIGGVDIYTSHRPETHGTMIHTEDAGAARNAMLLRASFLEQGDKVPDVCVFGHTHRPTDSSFMFKNPYVVYLPSWQLLNAYPASRGKVVRTLKVGGVAFLCQGGKFQPLPYLYQPPRKELRPWKISETRKALLRKNRRRKTGEKWAHLA